MPPPLLAVLLLLSKEQLLTVKFNGCTNSPPPAGLLFFKKEQFVTELARTADCTYTAPPLWLALLSVKLVLVSSAKLWPLPSTAIAPPRAAAAVCSSSSCESSGKLKCWTD
jgi:hypothetical protein